jgi:hypothetical protein
LAARGFCGHRQPGQLLGYRKYSGTQRDASWRQREALAPQIRQRYEGVTPMGCGCGPAGEALLRIRRALTEDEVMGTELQEGQTLMEYTGGKAGTSSVQSRSKRIGGRMVRYTYGGAERLIPVWNEDVSFLESIGFRRAVPPPDPDPVQNAPTVVAAQEPQRAPEPRRPAFAAERAAAVDSGPPEPAEVADVGAIEAKLDQRRLEAKAAEKAEQAKATVRGRPGRKPKGG